MIDEAEVISEALELQEEEASIRGDVKRMLPGELQDEAIRMRRELPQQWPALESLLAKVDDEEPCVSSDWRDTGLGRDAYLAFVRYQAVMHQLQQPEIPHFNE